MEKEIFRKKNMNRISSPEQLNQYIRATSPGVWMILGAVIVLLIGICVWGVFGRIETKVSTFARFQDGKAVIYVKADNLEDVKNAGVANVNGKECSFSDISKTPFSVDKEELSEYEQSLGNFLKGEFVYKITLDYTVNGQEVMPENGSVYPASIVIESIAPLSFVFN